MRRATFLLILLALISTSTRAAAQFVPDESGEGPGPSETAAFLALSVTPVGAFPDIIMPGSTSRQPIGFRFHLGHVDEDGDISRRSFGAGVDIPAGNATLGFTAGVQDFACPDEEDYGFVVLTYDCKKSFMGGASFGMPLVTSAMGDQGATVGLGLQATVGYGTGDDLIGLTMDDGTTTESFSASVSGLSATLGVPLSLVAKSGGISVVPHLTPRFGWGRATMKLEDSTNPSANEEETESGTRFMLSGGVGVFFQGGLGLTLGFQKVFIEDASATIGLGVSWNR